MASEGYSDSLATDASSTEQYTAPDSLGYEHADTDISWPRKVQSSTPLYHQDHVRLLHIESITQDAIECSLWEYTLPLMTGMPFAALSYCWGDGPRDQTIQVNGDLYPVTSNLFHAIQDTISFFEQPNMYAWLDGVENYPLWIDAICLNQDDEAEKSVQVRRMSDIYKGAKEVLIWLGVGTEETALVMFVCRWLEARTSLDRLDDMFDEDAREEAEKFLLAHLNLCYGTLQEDFSVSNESLSNFRGFLDTVKTHDVFSLNDAGEHGRRELVANLRNTEDIFSAPDGRFWTAFLSLMDRPWFTRVWTLQEMMLAQSASVICGGLSTVWTLLFHMRQRYFNRLWRGILYSHEIILATLRNDRTLFEIPWMVQMMDLDVDIDRNAIGHFQHILYSNFGIRKARDPRDIVYGLLGLLEPDLRRKLEANYELPTATVFTNAIKVISEERDFAGMWTPFMSFLAFFMSGKDCVELDLPSWCPNLTAQSRYWKDVTRLLGTLSEKLLTELRPPLVPTITDDMCMQTSVVLLDEIEFAVPVTPPLELFEELHGIYDLRAIWLMWRQIYPVTCQKWFSAMLDFVSRDEVGSSADNMKWLSSAVSGTINTVQVGAQIVEIMRQGATYVANERQKRFGLAEMYLPDLDLAPIDVLITSSGRYFMVTKRGRVGYSTRPTKPGYHLCFVPGGQCLHVLSQNCDRYVTPAIAQGLDEDDALIEAFGPGPDWTTVKLR